MSDSNNQTQTQLDQIFQNAPLGILMIDSEMRVVESNPALLNSLDVDKSYLQDKCFLDLSFPGDGSILEELFKRAEQTPGEYCRAEVRLLKGGESELWSEIMVGLHPPGVELPGRYLVIFQDIQHRKEMELEVVELHRRLNEQVEEDRIQLAQDLHDGAMQDLHSIHYQLSALQAALTEEDQPQIEKVMDTVREVRQELRTISYDLRPPTLSRFGLAKSIRSHAEEFIEKHPEFNLELDLEDDGTRLTEEIRLALFRIYQQALGNILQHAEATEIGVRLFFEGSAVELHIRDDGTGFTLPERWISLVREGHFGLAGSRDRVNNLGGDFQVVSQTGQGTEIVVRIPGVVEVNE